MSTSGSSDSERDTLIPAPAVREMFDRVAPRYDLLNRVLSMGVDGGWRRAAIRALEIESGDVLVDICGGTGDLSFTARRLVDGVRAVDVDFSSEMLAIARRKGDTPRPCLDVARGDATRLPLRDAIAGGAVIGFGIRNVADRRAALRECRRVLRPGGRLAILEFAMPRLALLRRPYLFYLRHVLPRIAGLATAATGAYSYLGDSILDFPERERFAALMAEAGFASVRFRDLSGGICVLYVGCCPSDPDGSRW